MEAEAGVGSTLEGEVASVETEVEVETTSHKERRGHLNSPLCPCLYLLVGKKGLWGFALLPVNDRAF